MAEQIDRLTQAEDNIETLAGHTTGLAKAFITLKADFEKFKADVVNGGKPSSAVQALGDEVSALKGDDKADKASDQDDTVKGSAGNDTVKGSTGNDTIGGDLSGKTYLDLHPTEAGNDTIGGSTGNDSVAPSTFGRSAFKAPQTGADNVG